LKKAKEKIRLQIIKTVEPYRGKRRIKFFDSNTSPSQPQLELLDNNELAVIEIKLDKANLVLLTTKRIFLIRKDSIIKIEGHQIESFEFLDLIDAIKMENLTWWKKKFIQAKLNSHTGKFGIIESDGTIHELVLKKRNHTYCLSNSITRLQFVSRKYESV